MRPLPNPCRRRPSGALVAAVGLLACAACTGQPAEDEGLCTGASRADIVFLNHTATSWPVAFGSGENTATFTVDGNPGSRSDPIPPGGSVGLGWDVSPTEAWAQSILVDATGSLAFFGNATRPSCTSLADDTVVDDLEVCQNDSGITAGPGYEILPAIQCVPDESAPGGEVYTGFLEVREALPSIPKVEWMRDLPDTATISQLSIPGTHDSATFTTGVWGVQTQRLNFLQQMDWGVRAFDLRVSNNMLLYHSNHYLNLNLRQFLGDARRFLDSHPSEFLIAFVKAENCKQFGDFDAQFWRSVEETGLRGRVIADKGAMRIPIGDLRGRIVVVTRKVDPGTCGWINGAAEIVWPENASRNPTDTGGGAWLDAAVSDNYKAVPFTKLGMLLSHIQQAAADTSPRLFVGFASGYDAGGTCFDAPLRYAEAVHPALWSLLVGGRAEIKSPKGCKCSGKVSGTVPSSGKLGILLMDLVGDSFSVGNIRTRLIERNPRK